MDIISSIEQYLPFNKQEEADREGMLQCFNTFDTLLTRENRIAHMTASAWIVNKARTKVLLVYHTIMDSWAWSGGHADGEKDMLAVALKEAKEETGLEYIEPISSEIYSLEVLTVEGHMKRGAYVGAHLHLNVSYLLEADDTKPICNKEDENSMVSWVAIENAPDMARMEADRVLYRKLNEKLRRYGYVSSYPGDISE